MYEGGGGKNWLQPCNVLCTRSLMLLSIDQTTRRKRGRYRATDRSKFFFHMAFFPFFTLCKLKAMKRGKLMCNGKVFASFTSPSSKKLQHQYCVYTYPVGDLGDYALSAAMSEVYACSIYYSRLLSVQKLQTWVNSTNSFPVKTFSFAAVENHMGELTKWIRSR